MTRVPSMRVLPKYWDGYTGGRYDESVEVDTAVPAGRLEEIARRITAIPAGFQAHAKVARGLAQRLEMGSGRRPIDFGMAEALAFGSLLLEGTPVRLSGQDSRRGTFNQRHAVLIDVQTGAEHYPLAHVGDRQARFDIYDTPLSEAAPLGFEYGFSRDSPESLVLWEAQFGDFVNNAQVIIDQFLAAGEDKWGLLSGLVLLLPHGYEGQGAEHSSARLERFLHLAAEDNIQVCQPTTAAQYFHLLRRQAVRRWRKPLVVLTPKGMLRATASSSPIADFTTGRFRALIPDGIVSDPDRILLCSGRIAHELRAERDKRGGHAHGRGARRAALSVPEDGDRRARPGAPGGHRDRLGAGGAAQLRGPRLRAPAAAGSHGGSPPGVGDPRRERQPRHRLPPRACPRAADARPVRPAAEGSPGRAGVRRRAIPCRELSPRVRIRSSIPPRWCAAVRPARSAGRSRGRSPAPRFGPPLNRPRTLNTWM